MTYTYLHYRFTKIFSPKFLKKFTLKKKVTIVDLPGYYDQCTKFSASESAKPVLCLHPIIFETLISQPDTQMCVLKNCKEIVSGSFKVFFFQCQNELFSFLVIVFCLKHKVTKKKRQKRHKDTSSISYFSSTHTRQYRVGPGLSQLSLPCEWQEPKHSSLHSLSPGTLTKSWIISRAATPTRQTDMSQAEVEHFRLQFLLLNLISFVLKCFHVPLCIIYSVESLSCLKLIHLTILEQTQSFIISLGLYRWLVD